jgi:hypothetical protein
MTRAAASPARTKIANTDPGALTLTWLLDELVKAEFITVAAARQVVVPPVGKDGMNSHPLVVAAAQDCISSEPR